MKIDGNELAIEQNELDREGRHAEAMAIKREFLKQVRESRRDKSSSSIGPGVLELCGRAVTTAPASRPALTTATALSA